MNLSFLKILQESFIQNASRNAFCINDIFYSYFDLSERIKCISLTLGRVKIHNDRVGIICENNLETYASIIACWLNGFAFVPILRINPIERNFAILEEAKIKIIINSNSLLDSFYTKNFEVLDFNELVESCNLGITVQNINHDAEAYILFTSGSTGKPKGVPITFGNLNSFLDAFSNTGFSIDKEDSPNDTSSAVSKNNSSV
jgi:acyl-CoA synthetase (AMP-forming)/AMP-acid ligase II